jgi:hypothetical protein
MKTRMCTLRWAGMVMVLAGMMWGTVATADPRCWGENGKTVRPLQDVYTETATAHSDDGRTLFVWSDARTGSYDVYAQLYDTDGEELWGTGVPVVQHEASQILPAACVVQGGWIIAWIDMRDNTYPWDGEEGYTGGNIRAQKLANSGGHLWDDSGVPVYSMMTEPNVIQIVAEDDGTGGALIAWRNDSQNYLGAQRVLANGNTAWASPLALTDAPRYRDKLGACGDGSGNLFVGWREYEYIGQEFQLHLTKISTDGTLPWGINGRSLYGAFEAWSAPQVCPDGANGCFVGWVDYRAAHPEIYAQHFNREGNTLWSDTGVAVCAMPNFRSHLYATTSRSAGEKDGLLLVWQDCRVNDWVGEIYAQKLTMDGQAIWTAPGRKICGDATATGGSTRENPIVGSDGHGGLVCVWKDYRDDPSGSTPSVYANRVLADGTLAWQGETGIRASQPIASGFINAVWANPSAAMCVFYTTDNDADYGLRRQKMNLADGQRFMPPQGTTVASGLRDGLGYDEPVAVAMAGGRTALLWLDQRSTLGNRAYVQIMDTAGHFEKNALGDRLLPNDGGGIYAQFTQQGPKVCSDGNGGFFAVVSDSRTGSWQLRAVHVNAQGMFASDSSGRVLEESMNDQERAFCVSDNHGGCYVAWDYYDNNWMMHTKLTRLNTACEAVWSEPLEFSTGHVWDQIPYALVPNPDGGCTIIAGDYYYDAPIRLLAARVTSDGNVLWQRALDFAEGLRDIKAVEDHLGGLFVLSYPRRDASVVQQLLAQHINERGEDNWGSQELTIAADSLVSYGGLHVAADDQLNLYVLYVVYQDMYQVYVQKITATGVRVWGERGLLLTERAAYENAALCTDGQGGALAVWQDNAYVNWLTRIMGKHIGASGQPTDPYWAGADGGIVFPSQSWYRHPVAVADGMGGFVVASGARLPTEATYAEVLYAQRLAGGPLSAAQENELAPRAFALQQNYPNPFNPTTEIAFDLPRTERVKLAVFDVLGRNVQTLADHAMPAGTHRVRFDGSALASGIYFYRLEAGEFRAVKKMVMVK